MHSRKTPRPTIIDVAAAAGVSKSLVSLVLRGASSVSKEKRRLVLAAAAELRYRPNGVARSLVQRRSNLFGILLSDLHNPFFAEVIDGVQAEAGAKGYHIIISVVDHRALAEQRALDTLLELRIDGLMLAGPMLEINAMTLASKEVPVVLVARRARVGNVDSVRNDDRTGAALVVQHLTDLGHERIAKDRARLALNLMLLAAACLPRGGELAADLSGAGFKVMMTGTPVAVPDSIRVVLAGGAELPDGLAAVANLARTLAEEAGGRLDLAASDTEARLSFVPLEGAGGS